MRRILFALIVVPPFYILCVLLGTAFSAEYQPSEVETRVCADILQIAVMPTGKEIDARHGEIIVALIRAHTLPAESRQWVQDCLAVHQVSIGIASQSDLIHLIALIVHAGKVNLAEIQFPKEFARAGKQILEAAFRK